MRIIGRNLFSTYTTSLENGTRVAMRTSGSDSGVSKEIFEARPYERFFKPGPGEFVVDAGANIGCFTLRASRLVGESGRIMSFEPLESNYQLLLKNIRLNGLTNVKPARAALGDIPMLHAELSIYASSGDTTFMPSCHGNRVLIGKQFAEIKTLDDCFKSEDLSHLDLIKIDTEGYELKVLKGATRTLERFHPKIVGEAHPLFSDSGEVILEFLKGLGYQGKVEPYHSDLQLFCARSNS